LPSCRPGLVLRPPRRSRQGRPANRARQAYENAHGEASETHDFTPSPELKSIYREAAKRIHPDFATDAADLERRTRFIAAANRAYGAGDAEALQRILDEYEDGAEAVTGEGIGAELIRIIRHISTARTRVSAIEQELAALRRSEIALLKKESEAREREGRDLLAELASAVGERIKLAKKKYESLGQQEANPA
jgi:DnaJ-class molecular chaperone